ncbi:hypothetical protein GCM10025331_33250 [Actinoplanes utahensis]|nr:hypothetical protein Aut01nite_48160 [Actinoplanes utahensis]
MIMSSGRRDPWRPAQLPFDAEAAWRLEAWLQSPDESFNAIGVDLRGSDLSGADLSEAWLTYAVLSSVSLRGVELHRAHLEAADLSDADLTGASLTRTTLDDARLCRTRLDGADLSSSSVYDVDARLSSFRGARFVAASVERTDFCGADLSDAVLQTTAFVVRFDAQTVVDGLQGAMSGSVSLVGEDGEMQRELRGVELEQWFAARGARVEVLTPRARL